MTSPDDPGFAARPDCELSPEELAAERDAGLHLDARRPPLAPPHPGVRTFCLLDHDCGPECPPRPYDPTEGHPRSMTETELRDHLGYPDAAETDLDRRYRARMRRRRETRDVCATIQQALITGTLPVICFLTVAILVAVLRSVW